MTKKNYRKGILFGIICVILTGFQPIISLSRPAEIDVMIFTAMACLIQALLFFPITIMERKKIRSDYLEDLFTYDEMDSLLYGYKKNKIFLLFLGTISAVAMVLFFLGFELAGAINSSLAAKTSIFFALMFGYLINKEKISITQIIFVFIIFFGLLLAITQSFIILEFNIGVLIMIISAALLMLGHSLTKPVIDRKKFTPIFLVCVRNALSGIVLISVYFFLFPIENVNLIFKPVNIFFFFLMGAVSSISLFFYYLTLKYLEVWKSTILMSPTPIVTALFALMILGEQFTIFHLIGAIIIIFSIIMIVKRKKKYKGGNKNMIKNYVGFIKKHLGYMDEEMKIGLDNPRNQEVIAKVPALLQKTIVIKVVESHGCCSLKNTHCIIINKKEQKKGVRKK